MVTGETESTGFSDLKESTTATIEGIVKAVTHGGEMVHVTTSVNGEQGEALTVIPTHTLR